MIGIPPKKEKKKVLPIPYIFFSKILGIGVSKILGDRLGKKNSLGNLGNLVLGKKIWVK